MSHKLKFKDKLTLFKIPIIALSALICAFVISQMLISFGFIYGSSMEPTYSDGDMVIVDRTFHTKESLKQGDVIIFKNENISSHLIVKRIIALPNQTVEIKNGTLYIDQEAVQLCGKPFDSDENMEKLTVSEGCFFVLGDNPSESKDSRHEEFGLIRQNDVIGKVTHTVFSPQA